MGECTSYTKNELVEMVDLIADRAYHCKGRNNKIRRILLSPAFDLYFYTIQIDLGTLGMINLPLYDIYSFSDKRLLPHSQSTDLKIHIEKIIMRWFASGLRI